MNNREMYEKDLGKEELAGKQEIRYLDKLVDELAKGKALEKILRG